MLLSIKSAYAFDYKTVEEPSGSYRILPIFVRDEDRSVCGFLCQEITVSFAIPLEGCIVLLYELSQPRVEIQKSRAIRKL